MKKQIVKLFFFLTLMMVSVVGKGQNWTWTGETPSAGGSYYLYNVGASSFLDMRDGAPINATGDPLLFTLTEGLEGTDLKYTQNGNTYYIYQSAGGYGYCKDRTGDAQSGPSTATMKSFGDGYRWKIKSYNTGYQIYSNHKYNSEWFSWNHRSDVDRYITFTGDVYNCSKNSDEYNNNNGTFLFITQEQMDACNAYIEAYGNAVNNKPTNVSLDNPYDMTGVIRNPNAEFGTFGWSCPNGVGVLDTDKKIDGKFFETAGWDKNSSSMSQTVTGLPNGYYVLQMKYQAAAQTTVKIEGNGEENSVIGTKEGWKDMGVVCQVTDGTLTITASSSTTAAENWANTDHFTLTYYGDADPGLTYNNGIKLDGSFLSKPAYTSTPADGVDPTHANDALLVVTWRDNYTNDPKTSWALKSGSKAEIWVDGAKVADVDLLSDFRSSHYDNGFGLYIPNFDETKTYAIKVPANVFGYTAVGHGNEAFEIEAVQSPLKDGKYFVVVKGTGKHVSRGKGWGTQAILDYYGVPMLVQTAGLTTFKFLDNNAFMGSDPTDNWLFTDIHGSEGHKVRRYVLVPGEGEHEGEFQFYAPARDKYLSHVQNSIADETYDAVNEGGNADYFQFEVLDEAGYKAHLAKIEEDEAIRVAARAGFAVSTKSEYDTLIKTWESKGYTEIFPAEDATAKEKAAAYHEKKNGELACDATWEGTPRDLVGGDKVSLSLDKGLYVMYCDAFQQAMALSTLQANQGFRGLTYMYVKVGSEMYKSQLKSITETTGTIPTDEASAKKALDTDAYLNQVIFYVPADGTTVEFGVENPQRLGNGVDATAGSWVAFKNIKVEKFVAELAEANLKCRPEVYGTFIAPFDVIMPEGITAYSATVKDDQSSVLLTKVAEPGEKLSAKTPVILKNKGTELVDRTYRDVSVLTEEKNIESGSVLTGFYVAGYVPTGAYVLQDQGDGEGQKFYKVSGEDPIMGVKNRCYLNALNSDGSAKVLRIEFADEETAIENLTNGATIVEYYSVNGTKLSAPQKGINLVKMSDSTVKKIFVK